MSPGSIGFAQVHSCAPRCRRIQSGSVAFSDRGRNGSALGVVGFVGSLELALGSSGSFDFVGFVPARPVG